MQSVAPAPGSAAFASNRRGNATRQVGFNLSKITLSMRNLRTFTALGCAIACLSGWGSASAKPNIVIVMADDMGYSDIRGGPMCLDHGSANLRWTPLLL